MISNLVKAGARVCGAARHRTAATAQLGCRTAAGLGHRHSRLATVHALQPPCRQAPVFSHSVRRTPYTEGPRSYWALLLRALHCNTCYRVCAPCSCRDRYRRAQSLGRPCHPGGFCRRLCETRTSLLFFLLPVRLAGCMSQQPPPCIWVPTSRTGVCAMPGQTWMDVHIHTAAIV